jgi:hypothetical protein
MVVERPILLGTIGMKEELVNMLDVEDHIDA